MHLINRIAAWAVFIAFGALVVPACAQQNLDALKQRCDDYGFARGTPEHADCVRKLDVQQAQLRCRTLMERGRQVCSKEFADIVSPAAAAMQCGEVQDAYRQYCQ